MITWSFCFHMWWTRVRIVKCRKTNVSHFSSRAEQERFITPGDRLNQMRKIRQTIRMQPGYTLYMVARALFHLTMDPVRLLYCLGEILLLLKVLLSAQQSLTAHTTGFHCGRNHLRHPAQQYHLDQTSTILTIPCQTFKSVPNTFDIRLWAHHCRFWLWENLSRKEA